MGKHIYSEKFVACPTILYITVKKGNLRAQENSKFHPPGL
jgi:hypothetical protein